METSDPAPSSGFGPPAAGPESDAALGPADRALASALAALGGNDAETAGGTLTRAALAERTGVPESLLEAMEREGLLSPGGDDGRGYGDGDVRAVAAGVSLLEAGLPLAELLDLARRHDRAMREIAEAAVELFVRFVRDPIQGSVTDPDEAGDRLVEAFQRMLPATSALVSHRFRGLLVAAARERVLRAERDDAGGDPVTR